MEADNELNNVGLQVLSNSAFTVRRLGRHRTQTQYSKGLNPLKD